MELKPYYVSKDFRRYAHQEFPNEYNAFRNVFNSKFEQKTYLDQNNAAHNASVLAVGHYHRRQGGPTVLAQATTSGIRYFQGKAGDPVVTPIPEEQVTRIYYDAPYSSLVGPQGGGGRTAAWKAGHHIVETTINVLFLIAKQVERISNPSKTDMLSNFKYVCKNTASKLDVQDITKGELSSAPAEPKNKKRKRSPGDRSQRIKQEEIEKDDVASIGSASRPSDSSGQHPSPMSYRLASSTPQAPSLDRKHTSKTESLTELEREKNSRRHEVQALRAKLLEQESRIQAAEENSLKEMKMRKRAEEQVENLRGQIATLKETRASEVQHHFNQRKELNNKEGVIRARNYTIRELEDKLAEMTQGWRSY